MAAMYDLRLVSKPWKESIENTPWFWTDISTSYPSAVIRDCLRLSRNYLLRVGISASPPESSKSLIGKLQILQPHAHRWEELDYYSSRNSMSSWDIFDIFEGTWDGPGLEDQRIRDFLESPAPRLKSLSVRFKPDRIYTPLPIVNLAGGQAKHVRRLTLENVPLPWSSHILIGLKTINLKLPSLPPAEEVLNIFVKSPHLRRFELSYQGVGGQEGAVAPPTPGSQPFHITAASLEEVALTFDHPRLASHILSRVFMPACRSLRLTGKQNDINIVDIHFPNEAFSQFIPRIGDAFSVDGRTTLDISSDRHYEWRCSSDQDSFQISLSFSGCSLGNLIECLRNLATASGLQLELEVLISTDDQWTVDKLSEWSEITRLVIYTDVASFPGYLAQTQMDPEHGLSWPFPNLQELDISYMECAPTKLFAALNGRYLADSHIQAMEDSGVTISIPPKLAIWIQDVIDYEGTTIMKALESHWGLESLYQVYRGRYSDGTDIGQDTKCIR